MTTTKTTNSTASGNRERRPFDIDIRLLPDYAVVNRRVVCALTGLSHSSVYRRIAQGTFPSPIKLGPSCSRWRLKDLRAWLSNPAGWHPNGEAL